jgi:hypothetical protein
MSWYIGEHKFPQRATFWKIVEDKGTWATVSLGTSKENKEASKKEGRKFTIIAIGHSVVL